MGFGDVAGNRLGAARQRVLEAKLVFGKRNRQHRGALVKGSGQMLMAAADGIDDTFRALGQRLLEARLVVGKRTEQRAAALGHDRVDALMRRTQRLGDFAGAGRRACC